jgi:hypothetical protein
MATQSNLKADFVNSNSNAFNEVIIGLAILKMLSAGIQPLKILQIPVELLLLAALGYACTTIKYDREQLFLLLFLIFVTACSFFTSDIQSVLINGKQNGGAVLSLLYFSKVQFKSRLIFPVFVLTLLLVFLNLVVPEVTAPLIRLSSFEEFNASRFGGLFLNAHFNAYFMAVALIYYGFKWRLFGMGIPIMYFTFSKIIFIAYVANLVATQTPMKLLMKDRIVAFAGAVLGVCLLWQYRNLLIDIFDTDELGSAVPVLMQLFDPAYYQVFLNPFPSEYIDVSSEAMGLYRSHDGYNEIGYFQLAMTSGVFLAVLYLSMLLRHARYYRVFILACLLHFGLAVLEPLIIYMLLTYSREIQIFVLSEVRARRSRHSAMSPLIST